MPDQAAEMIQIVPHSRLAPKMGTDWMRLHHLIAAREKSGIKAAAKIMKKLSEKERERALKLAYCLHYICDSKRRDPRAAFKYNDIADRWGEICRIADKPAVAGLKQLDLFGRQR